MCAFSSHWGLDRHHQYSAPYAAIVRAPAEEEEKKGGGGWRCEEEEADLISPFFPPSLIMPCFCSNVETTPEVKTELNLTET